MIRVDGCQASPFLTYVVSITVERWSLRGNVTRYAAPFSNSWTTHSPTPQTQTLCPRVPFPMKSPFDRIPQHPPCPLRAARCALSPAPPALPPSLLPRTPLPAIPPARSAQRFCRSMPYEFRVPLMPLSTPGGGPLVMSHNLFHQRPRGRPPRLRRRVQNDALHQYLRPQRGPLNPTRLPRDPGR